jgi:uncharacterized membrane protein
MISTFKSHVADVMNIKNERFLLRGIYKLMCAIGGSILVVAIIGLVVLLMVFPMMLADSFGNDNYIWLYLIHLICVIFALGMER